MSSQITLALRYKPQSRSEASTDRDGPYHTSKTKVINLVMHTSTVSEDALTSIEVV